VPGAGRPFVGAETCDLPTAPQKTLEPADGPPFFNRE